MSNKAEIFLGVNGERLAPDSSPLENNEVLVSVPYGAPGVAALSKGRPVHFHDMNLLIVVKLPEYINLQAFIDSKYSKICPDATKWVFHPDHIYDIVTQDETLKRDLVNSFIVYPEKSQDEYNKLYNLVDELDELIDPLFEYLNI